MLKLRRMAVKKSAKRYKSLFATSEFFRERYKFSLEKTNKKGIPHGVSLYSIQSYNISLRNANLFNIRKHFKVCQSKQKDEATKIYAERLRKEHGECSNFPTR